MDAEDGTLDQNNAKKYKSLVKDLCKVKQLAKIIVKRDMTGKSLTKRKLHFAGDYHEKTQKFTFSDDDFLFENQPSQEVVTLQPIDDSFDEYEQNLGKNQVPDEDENQQDYRLTTL